MKQIIFSVFFSVFFFINHAQTIKKTNPDPFTKVEVSGSISLFIKQSDTLSLKLVGDELDLNNIIVFVKDSTLIIKPKERLKNDTKIYITAHYINSVSASGTSKVVTLNTLVSDSLSLHVSGSGFLNLDIKTNNVDMFLNDASQLIISGNTNYSTSFLNGASNLSAYKLNSINTKVTTFGASTAKVSSSEKINAQATGVSSIKFKGEPAGINVEASSFSSIYQVAGDNVKQISGNAKDDSTTITFRKKKFVIINKEKDWNTNPNYFSDVNQQFKHWKGFGIAFNFFSSKIGEFSLNKQASNMELNLSKSSSIFFNPIQRNFHIYKNNRINFITGFGIQFNTYNFNKRVTLKADSSFTYARLDSVGNINYKRNTLNNTYLNIPFLLEFNSSSNPKKAFHFAFGVVTGIKLGSRTIQQYVNNGDKITIVRKDNFNQNLFRLNVHTSFGYNSLSLFFDYALTPLFQKAKGLEIYPFTIGINFFNFW